MRSLPSVEMTERGRDYRARSGLQSAVGTTKRGRDDKARAGRQSAGEQLFDLLFVIIIIVIIINSRQEGSHDSKNRENHHTWNS